jgi:hypothetical protein
MPFPFGTMSQLVSSHSKGMLFLFVSPVKEKSWSIHKSQVFLVASE